MGEAYVCWCYRSRAYNRSTMVYAGATSAREDGAALSDRVQHRRS
jgi:hypothetical protein